MKIVSLQHPDGLSHCLLAVNDADEKFLMPGGFFSFVGKLSSLSLFLEALSPEQRSAIFFL